MANFQDIREEQSERRTPSFDVLLRKFFREVQQSKILSEAKKRRFHSKDISRKTKRNSAIRKNQNRKALRGW